MKTHRLPRVPNFPVPYTAAQAKLLLKVARQLRGVYSACPGALQQSPFAAFCRGTLWLALTWHYAANTLLSTPFFSEAAVILRSNSWLSSLPRMQAIWGQGVGLQMCVCDPQLKQQTRLVVRILCIRQQCVGLSSLVFYL